MTTRPSLPELRRNARVSLRIPYRLIVDGQSHQGETGNVSMGGVSLQTCEPPLSAQDARKEGQLELDLDFTRLETGCRIVYVGNPNSTGLSMAGITFVGLDDEGRELLLKYIMQRL